uniref:Uncharacterized protein n=1 Tax=Panagrolaimus sp. ES5 TaxID=591445 RepID=A0AC34FJF0_9BILA
MVSSSLSSSSLPSSSSKKNSLFEEEDDDPMAAEDIENSVSKNKIFPLPPDEADPPSYDSAVAQEKAERGLIGALLLKTSHVFGMHPFKAPVVCDGDVCQKRRYV